MVDPREALVAATALHLGFQAVVTVVVYPALAATPAADWPRVHAAHTRRITPVVAGVYAAAAGACLWVLVAGPRTPTTLLAVAATAVAAGATALVAGPTHGRLDTPDPTVLRRLLAADRVRLGATLVAFVAALLS